NKTFEPPPPAFGAVRATAAAASPAPPVAVATAPAGQNPAAAAAAVSALAPGSNAPRVTQTPAPGQTQTPPATQLQAPPQGQPQPQGQTLAARPISATPAQAVERPLTPEEQQRLQRARLIENANRGS